MTETTISQHLLRSAEVKSAAAKDCSPAASKAASMIAAALAQDGTLLLCGNGGSAGDAQHIAAEFVATLDHARPRPGLRALALTTDTSFLTAFTNDFGYQDVFARQVETLGRSGDVLIGLSTSGNSANVVAAVHAAKAKGISTIAMTGADGGMLKDLADLTIAVPADQTALIQETHIALGHAITAAVEASLGF